MFSMEHYLPDATHLRIRFLCYDILCMVACTSHSSNSVCNCMSCAYSNSFLSSGSHWDCVDSGRWYSEVFWGCKCCVWSYSVYHICGDCGDCHHCMPCHCWLQAIQKETVLCQSTEWTTWTGSDQHGIAGDHDTWTDKRYKQGTCQPCMHTHIICTQLQYFIDMNEASYIYA